uniref:Uncharacterized protein n=1 Tax=Oryza glumipatula TaxID=40148 RepID=A0A0E0BQ67_9ORYZ
MDYLPQHKRVDDEEAAAADTGKAKEHGKEEEKQHGHSRIADAVEYVNFGAVQVGTAYLEKKYEAATGEKAVDKMVRLIGKEDTFKDRDQEDKNKGVVYQF